MSVARYSITEWSARERNQFRLEQRSVPRQKRNILDDARRRDQLICGIATDIEVSARPRNIAGQRPYVHAREHSDDIRIVEVERDSAQLRQLGDLPENDRRNAPTLGAEETELARAQGAGHRVEQHMRVNVQHSSRGRLKECRL